jgi:MYXO-CTERM domain-containing protein
MRNATKLTALVTGFAVVALLTPAATANLLADPGFESGTPVAGGVGGWEPFNAAAFSMAQAHTGDWSMELLTTNNVPGAYQAIPASPGDVFTCTGWALAPVALAGPEPAFGGIQISYFDAVGTDLGTVETGAGNAAADFRGINQPGGDFVPGVWEELTVTATAPAGTAKVQAFPIYIDFSGNTQGIYVDDMTLTPEPASLMLLGLAALALRRR